MGLAWPRFQTKPSSHLQPQASFTFSLLLPRSSFLFIFPFSSSLESTPSCGILKSVSFSRAHRHSQGQSTLWECSRFRGLSGGSVCDPRAHSLTLLSHILLPGGLPATVLGVWLSDGGKHCSAPHIHPPQLALCQKPKTRLRPTPFLPSQWAGLECSHTYCAGQHV